jgi:hypothetical protein
VSGDTDYHVLKPNEEEGLRYRCAEDVITACGIGADENPVNCVELPNINTESARCEGGKCIFECIDENYDIDENNGCVEK